MSEEKKQLVVQSNKLIEAHYKQEYTVQEQRTILWLISTIKKEDYKYQEASEQKCITVSASDYANIMGISIKNVYRDAKEIGEKLMEKVLKIKEPNGWLLVHWVSSMRYHSGQISVNISPEIIPYLIDLKEKFTSFRLENILYLQSTHAIKLYQLLAQYKLIGERTILINDLRSLLGVTEIKSYSRYNDVKRKILELSQREINNKTDITISYEEIKKSRKVDAVKFKITLKPTQEEQAIKEFAKYVLEKFPENHTLRLMFEKYGVTHSLVKGAFDGFTNTIASYDPTSRKIINFVSP